MIRLFNVFIFSVLSFNLSLGQERLDDLLHQQHILIEISDELRDSLSLIDQKLQQINEHVAEIEFQQLSESSTTLIISSDAPVFEDRNVASRRIGEVSRGDEVLLVEVNETSMIRVNTGEVTGYVARWNFDDEERLSELIARAGQESRRINTELRRQRSELESSPRYISSNTFLRTEASNDSEPLETLPQGAEVFLAERDGQWSRVRYANHFLERAHNFNTEEELLAHYVEGWVLSNVLSEEEIGSQSPRDRIALVNEQRRRTFVEQNPNLSAQHREDILNARVRIGMTDEMARVSWGRPANVNRTITANMVREQWVYGAAGNRRYLYFRNGVLTTIQD